MFQWHSQDSKLVFYCKKKKKNQSKKRKEGSFLEKKLTFFFVNVSLFPKVSPEKELPEVSLLFQIEYSLDPVTDIRKYFIGNGTNTFGKC